MIKKSYIISIVVIVSFLGISATWVISKANESINELPAVIKKVPDFSMTSHIGENFNQDSLLNKISILDFIFTSCPGPCPIMSNNMRTLYRQYKLHPDLQFISIATIHLFAVMSPGPDFIIIIINQVELGIHKSF